MKINLLVSNLRWVDRRCSFMKSLTAVALILCSTAALAWEDATYLEESNLLAQRLETILIGESVCISIADCNQKGGFVFNKPLKNGSKIFVYGIKSSRTISMLLQACIDSFATKKLGNELSIEVYSIKEAVHRNQTLFGKTPPTFKLLLEKTNVNN